MRDHAKTGLRKRFWSLYLFGITCPCCGWTGRRTRGRKDQMWGRLLRRRMGQRDQAVVVLCV